MSNIFGMPKFKQVGAFSIGYQTQCFYNTTNFIMNNILTPKFQLCALAIANFTSIEALQFH